MSLVYVLRCIDVASNKPVYYVGRTNHFRDRMTSHFGGRGSQWTKRYPPQEVIYQKMCTDPYDEDLITLRYMERHGIENVRGGSFSNPKLFPSQLYVISRMIANATGKSFYCKPNLHYNPNFSQNQEYPENHYKVWTKEDKETFKEETAKGTMVEEIAKLLKRTVKAVEMRLQK